MIIENFICQTFIFQKVCQKETISLVVKGNMISDDKKLANIFNTFFGDIVKIQREENSNAMISKNPGQSFDSIERHQDPQVS